MEQRLLFGRAKHQIMMVVADRKVDRPVVSPRDLGHAQILEIVILGPLDIRRRKRDISKLEDFRIEYPLHRFLLFRVSLGRQTIRWRCDPSIPPSSSTTSPRFKNCGGFRAAPTPSGVPVTTTSPVSRVMNWLKCERISATVKIMSLVLLFCRTAPLTASVSGIA